jgi:23S rRNA A1618 N6-methylase RlmF
MHDRNIYKNNPPNFAELAQLYPSFSKHVVIKNGQPSLDWNNPESLCELTKALLHKDFGVTIELPLDQLCPTVTSRVNYILWLEDLLDLPSTSLRPAKRLKTGTTDTSLSTQPQIRGIDIGTGASCVYPLLGVSMNGWKFVATDIDETSVSWAQKNVAMNGWEDFVQVKHVSSDSILLSLFPDVLPSGQEEEGDLSKKSTPENFSKEFDFCMCNPPFFESLEQKIENPHTQCNATQGELVTEGGEVAFVIKMAEESLLLRDRITWYTSLLGRKVSVKKILKFLHENGIKNTRTTTFYQGHTTRWAIAWSFGESASDLRKITLEGLKGKKEFSIGVSGILAKKLVEKVEEVLRAHQVSWNSDPDDMFTLYANVYESSLWLKGLKQEGEEDEDDEEEVEDKDKDGTAPVVQCIGPMMPPRLAFSLDIKIFQISHQQYSVKLSHASGDQLSAFAELYLDLKSDLQSK